MADLASALLGTAKLKKYNEILAEQASSTAPTPSWGAALARALQGGLAGLYEKQDRTDRGQRFDNFVRPFSSEGLAAQLAGPQTGGGTPTEQAPSGPRVYSQDEPNPMDVPTGAARDLMARTMAAEAGNQGPEGQQAVANVIRNRAVNGGFGGDTVPGVIQRPHQFEPVNTADGQRRMRDFNPNSQLGQQIDQQIERAYAGNDPTNGAVNFINPQLQARLGRATPPWAQGPGQDIGDHRFFGGQQPQTQTAQLDPAALPENAQPTQGPPLSQFAQGPSQPPAPQPRPSVPAANGPAPQIPPGVLAAARELAMSGDETAAYALISPHIAPHENKILQLPDGTVLSVDARTNRATPVYSAPPKPQVVGEGASLVGENGRVIFQGTPKPPQGYEPDPNAPGQLRAIPGGPGTHVPGNVGGQVALMDTARQDLPAARETLLRNRGEYGLDLGGRAQSATNMGDIGRANRTLRYGVEAALRTMSGAAVPESEVNRYTDLFTPSPNDNPTTARQKLDALESFMQRARENAMQGRTSTTAAPAGANSQPRTTRDPLGIR